MRSFNNASWNPITPSPTGRCWRLDWRALRHAVIVDVDDVVEHAHGGAACLRQFLEIQRAIRHMCHQIDRTQVANGGFASRGV